MKWIISGITPTTQFIIVVLIAFGYFIVNSVLFVLFPPFHAPLSQSGLYFLMCYEPLILLIIALFLHLQGWGFSQLGISPRWMDPLVAVGLCFASSLAYMVLYLVVQYALGGADRMATTEGMVEGEIGIAVVLAASLINAVFEETIACAYVIAQIKARRGPWFAIGVSVAIRVLYHLYQGLPGVVFQVAMGTVFGYWFARKNRIFPPIIAHFLFDVLGLLAWSR